MDHTKLRVMAAAFGILLGLGGTFTLFVAVTLALAEIMSLTAAAFTVAGVALVLGGVCLFIFIQPFRSIEEEVDEVEEVTAEALADLPFNTLRTFVERRPLTTTALALAFGYAIVRHPQAAQRQAERFIMSLL
ncbi:MAG: hypothetical protein R3B94_15580 [Hyphomonas sp.]